MTLTLKKRESHLNCCQGVKRKNRRWRQYIVSLDVSIMATLYLSLNYVLG